MFLDLQLDDGNGPEFISMGMNENTSAKAFLELFAQSSSLPNKSVDVVPVLRADDVSRSFLNTIKTENDRLKSSNNGDDVQIRLTDPVEYVPSNYPKSDAMQIISNLGMRLAMSEKNTVVFLISSDTLPYLIDMSRLNKELRERKWVIKGNINACRGRQLKCQSF